MSHRRSSVDGVGIKDLSLIDELSRVSALCAASSDRVRPSSRHPSESSAVWHLPGWVAPSGAALPPDYEVFPRLPGGGMGAACSALHLTRRELCDQLRRSPCSIDGVVSDPVTPRVVQGPPGLSAERCPRRPVISRCAGPRATIRCGSAHGVVRGSAGRCRSHGPNGGRGTSVNRSGGGALRGWAACGGAGALQDQSGAGRGRGVPSARSVSTRGGRLARGRVEGTRTELVELGLPAGQRRTLVTWSSPHTARPGGPASSRARRSPAVRRRGRCRARSPRVSRRGPPAPTRGRWPCPAGWNSAGPARR